MIASFRLSVMDSSGVHLFWADETRARELLRQGEARLIRRGGQDRALIVRTEAFRMIPAGRGTALGGRRYSHCRETRDNPQNVWTLVKAAR